EHRSPDIHHPQRSYRRRRRHDRNGLDERSARPTSGQRSRGKVSAASAGFYVHVARLGRGETVERSSDDRARRILQGRAGTLELTYDRTDAYHVRFLSALHEVAG